MKTMTQTALLGCIAALSLYGCMPAGGGGGGEASSEDGGAADAAAEVDASPEVDAAIEEPPPGHDFETCVFNEGRVGNGVGSHIADFEMEQWDGTPWTFHENCGGGVKAIWIFLSTGWCAACEQYADKAERYYQSFKDMGLRIVWIVGEDAAGNAPTPEYMRQYYERKNVTFTVLRDDFFMVTQQFIDPVAAGNSLPRQYILDGRAMEMQFADGGVGSGAESIIACTHTSEMSVEECMNRGR